MLSTYLQGELIDWIRGNAMPAAPGAVYLSLHTANPNANGASEHAATDAYARTAVTFEADGDVAAGIEFAEATGDYSGPITHIGLWDAAGAGNFLVGGPLDAPATIEAGEIPRVSAAAVALLLNKT